MSMLSFLHQISLSQAKDSIQAELTKKINDLTNSLRSSKSQLTSVVAEKTQLKRTCDNIEKTFQAKIADVKAQAAPLERRYQELTKALVNAKEMETAATKESREQCAIAKEVLNIYSKFTSII